MAVAVASCGGGGGSTTRDAGGGDAADGRADATPDTAATDTGAPDTPGTPAIAFTFDTGLDGFAFDPFQDPTPGAVRNVAAPRTANAPDDAGADSAAGGAGGGGGSAGSTGAGGSGGNPDAGAGGATGGAGGSPPLTDGGVTIDARPPNPLGPPPTLDFDAITGNPGPGSLKATVAFTDFNQVVDVARRFDVGDEHDWHGKILHVKVLLSGSFGGGAVLYVLTRNPPSPIVAYFPSGWTLLQPGQWRDITLDLRAVPTANLVTGFGVQFGTGGPPTPGSTFTNATPMFHIDSFTD